MQDRYERYRGFELKITYLSKHEVEVYAERTDFPMCAMYSRDIKEIKSDINRFWKERRNGAQ